MYTHKDNVWLCSIDPRRGKALVGFKVSEPDRFVSVRLSYAGMEIQGTINSKGELLFWKPFRLVSDHLKWHWNEQALLIVLLTEKEASDKEPLLELEWTDTVPGESAAYESLILIFNQARRSHSFSHIYEKALLDFPEANNVLLTL